MIDAAVWAQVAAILRDPSVIAREVSRHRDDGGVARDLAVVEKRLAGIVSKQTKIARAIARVDDAAAEPLYAELTTLAASKTAAHQERDELLRRIADQGRDVAWVTRLTDWCARVSQNLETLTYDEKRLALAALGVRVRAYRKGSVDETGTPYPRWELTMNPISPDEGIAFSTAH
jgi:hypothetical protein